MRSWTRKRVVVGIALTAAWAATDKLWAASATWDGDAAIGTSGDNATWSNANNWTTNGVVDTAPSNTAPGDDLIFGNGTAGGIIDLTAARVANSLTFNKNYTLGTAATALVLTNTSGNVSVDSGVTGTINAVLAGANGISLSGGGTLQLVNTANTFTGSITVSGASTILAFTGVGNADQKALGAAGARTITLTNGGGIRPITAASDPAANTKAIVIGSGGGVIDTPVTLTLNDGTGAAAQFSGSGDLTKTGSGTLILGQGTAANYNFSGFTGSIFINDGTIQEFGTSSSLGTNTAGTTINSNTAVLDVQGVTTEPITINGTNATGSLVANAGTGAVGAVTLTQNGVVGGAGTLTLGAVSESGGSFGLTKVGTGTTILGAADSYSGTTTVSAGILRAAKLASLPNQTTPGAIVIASGATLVMNAGGTGEFTTADIDNVVAKATFSAAGSEFGVDTTNAGGNFTYSSDITGAKSFGKFGTGTLTLGGTANAISGTLTISGGTLDIGANDFGLAGGTSINGTGGTINATGGGRLLLNVANGDFGSSGTVTINAVIANGSQSSPDFYGGGVVVLTANNTFTGTANIQNNTVSVATIGPGGAPSPLGTNTTVNLGSGGNTGTLRYTGTTGETVTRTIALAGTTGGGGLDQSGGGLLKFNTVTFTGAGSKTLTLTGSGTGTGEVAANIVDQGGSNTTSVLKSGTTTWTLTGTNTYTGATSVNQGTLSLGTNDFTGTTLLFGNVNTVTTTGALNLTGANATFSGLMTAQTNSTSASTVTIGAGKVLSVAGGLTVGINSGSATTTKLTVGGAGSFNITGGSVQLGVSQGTANSTNNSIATLDLTGLTGAAGFSATGLTNFNVGQGNDVGGTALLTNTANTITATTLNVGASNNSNQGGNSLLTLGTGTNVLSADAVNIGVSKATGALNFASQAAGSAGTVTITNKAGTGATPIDVGDNTGTATAATATGTLDLRGHVATVSATTLNIGVGSNTAAGGGLGTVSFDTGTFTVSGALVVGSKSGTNGIGAGNGTLNIGGATPGTGTGTFTVNSTGSFTLATNTATTGTAVANVNVTGGSLISNVAITKGGGTGTTATITLDGGTLDMTGHAIGTAAQSIVTNLQSGTFQNVSEVNGGAGITKTGAGALTLAGTNNYTGGTTISAGTVLANSATSSTGSGSVIVNSTGTLGGSGNIAGAVTVNTGGTISPGNSPGTLSIAGPVTFGTGGTSAAPVLLTELTATPSPVAGTDNDLLALTGSGGNGVLTLSNPDTLNLLALQAITSQTTYTIATFASEAGVFDNVLVNGSPAQSSNPAGANYVLVSYNPSNIQVTVNNLTATPEPASLSLMAIGAAGLLARRRRRKPGFLAT